MPASVNALTTEEVVILGKIGREVIDETLCGLVDVNGKDSSFLLW